MRKRTAKILCSILFPASIVCIVFSLLHAKTLFTNPFSRTLRIDTPSSAKYERDGNLYVIDKSAFRLLCLNLAGEIQYIIEVDKENRTKKNRKIYDSAVDVSGNLYLYLMETDTDSYFTKRDEIRQYDSAGNFLQVIYAVDYTAESIYRPHAFPEFGSLFCSDRYLTFSRTMATDVEMFVFDILSSEITETLWTNAVFQNHAVSKLMLKDFSNFVYVTRDGNVFEAKDAGAPALRAAFDFSLTQGGVVPWYIQYGENGELFVGDVISACILRITEAGFVESVVPEEIFETLYKDAGDMILSNFGSFNNKFAGVAGTIAWFFDGVALQTYTGALSLPQEMILFAHFVQAAFVLALIFFAAALLLVIRICDGFVSLYIKQFFIAIPLASAAAVFMYVNLNALFEKRLNNEIFSKLEMLCAFSAKTVDGDRVKKLTSLDDFSSDNYSAVLQSLKDCIGNNKNDWSKALYSAVYAGARGEYQVCVSNEVNGMFTPIVPIAPNHLHDVLRGKITTESVNTADRVFLFADGPIFDSVGNFVGIIEVGADLTAYGLHNAEQKWLMKFYIVIVFVAGLLAQFLILFFFNTNLAKMGFVIDSITIGDFSKRIDYKGNDEIGKVNNGLEAMSETLQNKITHINATREATMRFVPLQFMEYLGIDELTQMKLGDSVHKRMTVLFFDIRAFSLNSEMMSTSANFKFVNTIMEISGPIVRKHNGFVDKFIGDVVMVLFAAAADALRAGIKIYQALVLNKATAPKVGIDGINIGIGINTGSVMLGIIGEEERLSSTVISKHVNLAARMESLTKQVGAGMLITRSTMSEIEDAGIKVANRFVGMIQFAGTNDVCGVFDILEALPPEQRHLREKTKEIFESGVRRFHAANYEGAFEQFKKVFNENPNDGCAKLYMKSAKKHIENPELLNIFVFNTK
ncbi:MAG: hypothetical protein Ta2A_19970 [Treponemataceae bacterium]|nr:MAG: hypothetical protein Ta2A_19970 [Treponemataceae bacterium]